MGRSSSRQTRAVLTHLALRPCAWQHGYELAKATELKSGTLYPILARLAERGLLETMWESTQPVGRPRRHLYRLTAEGIAAHAELEREAQGRPSLTRAPGERQKLSRTALPLKGVGHAH